MAHQTQRLLLQVDAATELLRRHLAEGEQPIERFERRAARMADNVDRSIGDMGKRFGAFASLAENAATRAQQSFEASFGQVQRLAATAIKGPTVDGRINLGADDIRAGAAAAQDQARAFALIGEAAQRSALAVGDTSEATRLFIQATNASRLEAERKATALLAEAGALERVEIELRQSAEATELFVAKHQRVAAAAEQQHRLAASAAEAATAERALAASATMLRGQLDPMFAAQQRFDAELTRAEDLYRAGAITLREYEQAQQLARETLQTHAQAVAGASNSNRQLIDVQQRGAVSAGQQKAAMQQLSFQLNDIATGYASGTPLMQIFAQQSGQVFQALGMLSVGAGGAGKAIEQTAGSADDAGIDVAGLGDQVKGVAEKAEGMTGKFGAAAAFLAGPWGAAVIAGVAILTPFVAKLLESNDAIGDAVDKLTKDAEQTDATRQAKDRFAISTAGVAAAIRDGTAATKAAIEAEKSSAEQANISAKKALEREVAERKVTLAILERARAESAQANSTNFGAAGGAGAAAAQSIYRDRVAELEALAAEQKGLIAEAEARVQQTRIDLAVEAAVRSVDPMARIKKLYDDQVAAARAKAREEKLVTAELTKQLASIERNRKAAIKAEQDRQTAANAADRAGPLTTFQSPVAGGRVSGRFGETRPGHQHAGIDYAVPVGTPVRAPAAGVIDVAGARQGYGNAIYINFGGGTTGRFGHLSKFNVKPGDYVDAGDVIGYSGGAAGEPGSGRSTGPHLHYEVRQGGRAVDPLTGRFRTDAGGASNTASNRQEAQKRKDEAQARREEAARQKLLRDETSYTDQERAARQKLLDATRKTAQSEVQRDQLLRESINAEADATEQKIANQFEAGQINLAQAQHLYSINEATRSQRLQNVATDAAQRTINARFEAEEQSLDTRLTQLRLEQDLAVNDADRRRIGRQILEIEQLLRRKKLEQVRDTSNDPDAVQRAKDQLEALPATERLESDQEERRSAGPLDAYRQRLAAAAHDTNSALQGIAVNGLGTLEDKVAEAAGKILKLKGAFGELVTSALADLARLAARMVILSILDKYVPGASKAATQVLGRAGGGRIEAKADGGRITGPGTGTSDSIFALIDGAKPLAVSNGESIVTAEATARFWPIIDAMNKGRFPKLAGGGLIGDGSALRSPTLPAQVRRGAGGRDRMQLDVRVRSEPSPLLMTTIEETSLRTVGMAAEPIMAGAQSRTIRRLQRPDLPGGLG